MNATDVLALVADVAYTVFPATAGSAPTTVCRIVTVTGWSIVASSTPARIEGFDPAIGERLAYGDCVRQLAQLDRYRCRAEAAS